MTTNTTSTSSASKRLSARLQKGMLTLLIVGLLTTSNGCARVKVIPADKAAVRMPAGKPFTPQIDGWFFPDALTLEIREQLSKARLDKTP